MLDHGACFDLCCMLVKLKSLWTKKNLVCDESLWDVNTIMAMLPGSIRAKKRLSDLSPFCCFALHGTNLCPRTLSQVGLWVVTDDIGDHVNMVKHSVDNMSKPFQKLWSMLLSNSAFQQLFIQKSVKSVNSYSFKVIQYWSKSPSQIPGIRTRGLLFWTCLLNGLVSHIKDKYLWEN